MEEGFCNLEVDVNGEETFMVDKVIFCKVYVWYHGRFVEIMMC